MNIETDDLVRCNALNNTYTDREPYYGDNIYRVDYRVGLYLGLELGHEASMRVLPTDCDLITNQHADGLSEEGVAYMKTKNR